MTDPVEAGRAVWRALNRRAKRDWMPEFLVGFPDLDDKTIAAGVDYLHSEGWIDVKYQGARRQVKLLPARRPIQLTMGE